MPVSARQLKAWHPPNVTGNVWNPIAFTQSKQAKKQRQPVGLQTQVRQRGRKRGNDGGTDWRPIPLKLRRGLFGGRKLSCCSAEGWSWSQHQSLVSDLVVFCLGRFKSFHQDQSRNSQHGNGTIMKRKKIYAICVTQSDTAHYS